MKVHNIALALGMAGLSWSTNIAFAQAANFSFQGSNGYTATGSYTTKSNAPTSFSEVASSTTPFSTQYLQDVTLSVFDSNNTLLQSGSSVTNGTSSDQYLLFTTTATGDISGIDISTQFPANNSPYYYLTNNTDPSGNEVPVGTTTYNLFQYDQGTDTATFLASATSLVTTSVPEHETGLMVLGLPLLIGVGMLKKRNPL
jgi:hypothetical protein